MMRLFLVLFLTVTTGTLFIQSVNSQETRSREEAVMAIIDSLKASGLKTGIEQKKPEIAFTREEALEFLQEKYRASHWINFRDPLRQAIGQVVYTATHDPFDSLKAWVENYQYDSINIPWERFYDWDSVYVKIPVVLPPRYVQPSDSVVRADTIGLKAVSDTGYVIPAIEPADTLARYKPEIREPAVIMKDTIFTFIADTLYGVMPFKPSHPFNVYRYPYQGDSIAGAIKTLVSYVEERDSSLIRLTGEYGTTLPLWLNSRSGKLSRYWLRNEFDDSVTVWVGPAGKNTIGIFLEDGIMFRRPSKHSNIYDAQLTLKEIDSEKLMEINRIYVKPNYWRYRSEASFVLNQAFLSNWVKGGEGSVSTTLDITGYATYLNKNKQLSSINFARIKYGLVATEENGVRKNLDLLETNSKLNHKAFGKVDVSGTMLFKTQLSAGKSYFKVNNRDTSKVVSKFLNPAILTVGFGLDYKPDKKTSINMAPLSYKGTFVTDTVNIDQTKYGIPKDRKSLNEPGFSFQFNNEFKPTKSITIINRVQLFTNYIHNPLNIDIDWELIATASLNWFTDVRLNTHLIYDDDTKTPKLDDNGSPILDSNGKPIKSARPQFKELLGFSFIFRF